MAESSKEIGVKFLAEQDRLRGGPAEELCGDGYTCYAGSFPAMDYEAHKQTAAMFYGAFSDLRHDVDDAFGAGDRAAVRVRIRGTHDGDLMGIPPSGKTIDVGLMAMFTVSDGKVVELREEFDMMGIMQQIGAVPSG